MEREYVRRGRPADVREVADAVALKPGAARSPDDGDGMLGAAGEIPPGALGETQAGFEADGWVFVAPGEDIREAVRERRPPPGAAAVQRTFVKPNGEVVLGLADLVVQLRPGMSGQEAEAAIAAAGLEIVERLTFARNLFQVRVPPGRDFLEVSRELSEHPDFLFAEPVFLEPIPTRFQPNPKDPFYDDLWHILNTGQLGGTPDADLRAEGAWDTTRGRGARIAIVDHGFDVHHPDLSGAVDGAVSAHFRAATNATDPAVFVPGLAGMPSEIHGTFCAGVAIARAGNEEGGCGVANEAAFIAVATTHETNQTQVTLAKAIAYAADPTTQGVAGAGAHVISCSLAPSGMDSVLQLAIDGAVMHGRGGLGTPIFWAVSNVHEDIALDEVCSYANTIAVGCSTRTDDLGPCAFGDALEFLAPGIDVFSTRPGNSYGTDSGTSYAAPAAAGVAALLIAADPDLTWQQVRQAMRDSCRKIVHADYGPTGHLPAFGHGRIDAAAAIALL